ncbi:hypothetical protein H5P28_11855 [Ruficoccus amylovorans]|uniref:Uncharacterized protein n=1 Tax=Ruficoccus amylovorans TaxID=1804625 RepID=A0A842HEU8_9BACT|nr:hypothetical protein [Ruficoccus amylovorans]MBC2594952.1 hypothetical protein [Ruficoccus amylovorans]
MSDAANKPTDSQNVQEPERPEAGGDTTSALETLQEYGVDVSDDAVQDALLGDKSVEDIIAEFGKTPPETPKEEAVVEGDDEPPAKEEAAGDEEEETPVGDDNPEGEPQKEDKGQHRSARVRIASDEDLNIVLAAKELGISITEYFELQRAKQQPASGNGQPQQQAQAEPVKDTKVEGWNQEMATLDEEMAELEKQIDQANEDLETATAMKLSKQFTQKMLEKGRIELRIEAYEAGKQNSFEREAADSRNRMIGKYPELGKTGRESLAFQGFISTHRADDPVFMRPNWIEVLADKFAEQYGTPATSPAKDEGRKASADAPKPQRQPQGKQQLSKAKLLDSQRGTKPPEVQLPKSEAEQEALIDQALEEIDRLPPGERTRATARLFGGKKQVMGTR